jgi:hypothetical protein
MTIYWLLLAYTRVIIVNVHAISRAITAAAVDKAFFK